MFYLFALGGYRCNSFLRQVTEALNYRGTENAVSMYKKDASKDNSGDLFDAEFNDDFVVLTENYVPGHLSIANSHMHACIKHRSA